MHLCPSCFCSNISVRIAERKVYYHSDWHWLTTYGLYPSIIYICIYPHCIHLYPNCLVQALLLLPLPPRQPRPQRLANAHAHAAAAALWRRRGGGGLRQVVVFTHLDDHALSISWGFHGIIMAITLWLCQAIAIEAMAHVEIVDLAIDSMVDLAIVLCKRLPKGTLWWWLGSLESLMRKISQEMGDYPAW